MMKRCLYEEQKYPQETAAVQKSGRKCLWKVNELKGWWINWVQEWTYLTSVVDRYGPRDKYQ